MEQPAIHLTVLSCFYLHVTLKEDFLDSFSLTHLLHDPYRSLPSHPHLVTCRIALRLHFVTTYGLGGGSVAASHATILRSLRQGHLREQRHAAFAGPYLCQHTIPGQSLEVIHWKFMLHFLSTNRSLLQAILVLVPPMFLGIEACLGH